MEDNRVLGNLTLLIALGQYCVLVTLSLDIVAEMRLTPANRFQSHPNEATYVSRNIPIVRHELKPFELIYMCTTDQV